MTDILTPMMTEDEFLEHWGKKGMKWGVRKDPAPSVKRQTESMTAKTSKGETLQLEGQKTPTIARAISRISSKYRGAVEAYSHYSLKDPAGKKIGELSLHKESPTSLNVVWVEVNESARGHGYASAAMNASVKLARAQNLKTVTLEVPGISPDARHIYERMGFKSKGLITPENDIWGGLTKMQLDLDKLKHERTDILTGMMSEDEFLEHFGKKGATRIYLKIDPRTGHILGILPAGENGEVKHSLQKGSNIIDTLAGMMSEEDFLAHMAETSDSMTEEEYLEHYGKKGMKWGQRAAESQLGGFARSRNVRKESGDGKQSKEARSGAIDAARGRVKSGANRQDLKKAKATYKASKRTEGAAAAKAALRAVRDKNADDAHDSRLSKAGGEKVALALVTVGLVAVNVAYSAGVNRR